MFRQIYYLIRKDLLLEWRQKYAFYGILLYVASTVFVLYMAVENPGDSVWNALFWVIQLFITVNTVAKSFLQESAGRMLYYYHLSGPLEFILAKLIYNVLLMLVMSILALGLFILLLGNPLINIPFFLAMVLLGGGSLGLTFTMLAAIAAKANQNAALMAIMGFPVVIPMVMLLVHASQSAFQPVFQPGLEKMLVLLGSLDLLVIALSIILFPFLWKN